MLFTWSTSYFQTHPSQSCFMSSVDLHTHYSCQVIDSVSAIVMIKNVCCVYVYPFIYDSYQCTMLEI